MPASERVSAREDAKQARLPGAVEAHHEEALPSLHVEGHVLEDGGSPVALREPLDGEHRAARVRRLREPEPNAALVGGRSDLPRLQSGHPRVERLGLASALRGLPPHRVGQGLQPPDLGLLAGGERGEPLLVAGPRLAVLRIRAAVLDDPVPVQMQDPRDRGVEERDVVAHDEERPSVPRQEPHQPTLRVGVEVVRRLVQQEEVGAAEQDPRKLEPTTLAARERSDRQAEPILGEPEPGDDRPRIGLGPVPAEPLVLLLQPGEARDPILRRVLLEPEPRLLHPSLQLDEPASAQEVLDAAGRVVVPMLPRILSEVAQRPAALHRPRLGRHLAGEDPERAGLAGAVAADDTHLVAARDGEVEIAHDRRAAGLDREASDLECVHGDGPG